MLVTTTVHTAWELGWRDISIKIQILLENITQTRIGVKRYLRTVSMSPIRTSSSGSWIIDMATGSWLNPGVICIILSKMEGRLNF